MLKLLKYEYRAVGRIILPAGGLLLLLSVLVRLVTALFDYLSGGTAGEDGIAFLALTITVLTTICVVAAVFVLTCVTVIRRYYMSLYSDEGYLTNTLPMAPWRLIASKLIVAVSAVIFALLLSCVGMFILAGANLSELWHDISNLIAYYTEPGLLTYTLVVNLLGALVSAVVLLLTVYAAIAIGQFWREHRVAGGLLAYLGISFVLNIVNTVVQYVVDLIGRKAAVVEPVDPLDDYSFISFVLDSVNSSTIIRLMENIVVCVVMFIVADQLLKRRLEIQ